MNKKLSTMPWSSFVHMRGPKAEASLASLMLNVLSHWIWAIITLSCCSTEIRSFSYYFQPYSHALNAYSHDWQTSSDLPASCLSQITSLPFLEVTDSAIRKLEKSEFRQLKSRLWTFLRSWWHQSPLGCDMFSGSVQPLKCRSGEKKAVVLLEWIQQWLLDQEKDRKVAVWYDRC